MEKFNKVDKEVDISLSQSSSENANIDVKNNVKFRKYDLLYLTLQAHLLMNKKCPLFAL